MQRKWIVLSVCAMVLAGCQTSGGLHTPPPTTPPPTSQAGTTTPPPTAPGETPTTSPWEAARAHGMIFRASGQAPDWSVEVQKSRAPTLFIALNDQQRQLQVPNTQPLSDPKSGTVSFSGNAQDGTPVQLTIHRGQCQQDMDGEKLAASAELNIGSRQYSGCGKFLFQ